MCIIYSHTRQTHEAGREPVRPMRLELRPEPAGDTAMGRSREGGCVWRRGVLARAAGWGLPRAEVPCRGRGAWPEHGIH